MGEETICRGATRQLISVSFAKENREERRLRPVANDNILHRSLAAHRQTTDGHYTRAEHCQHRNRKREMTIRRVGQRSRETVGQTIATAVQMLHAKIYRQFLRQKRGKNVIKLLN